MFRNVQLRVKQAIGQDPWLSFPTLPAVFLAGAKTAQDMELEAWSEVKDEQDPRRVADFLSHFPDGIFAPLAKALIAQFEQQAKVAAARQIEEQRRQDEALKSSIDLVEPADHAAVETLISQIYATPDRVVAMERAIRSQ